MNSPSTVSKLDFLGSATSLLCAIHCAGIPLLLSLTAWGQLAFFLDPVFENTVLAVSAVIGLASLMPSYFRYHRKPNALYLLVASFTLAGAGRVVAGQTAEVVLTSCGALCITLAHYTNRRLCKNCRTT